MSILLAAFAAVAPGLYAWLSGRRLIAALGDPVFPDMHFARARKVGFVTLAGTVAAVALAGGTIWWTVPLAILGLLTGTWPSRRVLFDETWPFARYMGFSLTALVGFAGFWVLLVWAPALIVQLGRLHGALGAAAALTIAALLIAINGNYPRFWLAMHRASPLVDLRLDERFEAILARAECVRPTVHRYGVPGGHIMNALALPSATSPAIAFGDSLLGRMEPDEVAAIFAHEVAHLEHFTPARMRRLALATWTLVALATALPAALAVTAPRYGAIVSLAMLFAVVLVLARLIGRSQANETASDLRAAELTGDAETVIRALTTLHDHLRLPRHWPQEIEPQISHPSLARRIQAIREHAAGTGGAALPGAAVVRSTVAGTRVVLDDARAWWFDGLPDSTPDSLEAMREQASRQRAFAYSELSELRLVSTSRARALKARDLAGLEWTVTIHPDDVPVLQRALEVVDTRFGRRQPESSRVRVRLLAAALLLAVIAAGEIGIVLVPLAIALFRPGTATVAAMGAMAIAQAVIALLTGGLAGAGAAAIAGATGMIVLGACALWLVWRARVAADPKDERATGAEASPASARRGRLALDPRASARIPILALGAAASFLALLVARAAVHSTPELVLSDPLTLALAVAVLGAAGALATIDAPRWRRIGIAGAIVASVAALAGATNATAVYGGPMKLDDVTASRLGEIPLASHGYRLELSPGGRRWAVAGAGSAAATYGNDGELALRWTIGRVDSRPGAGVSTGAGSPAVAPDPAGDPGSPPSASAEFRELEAVDVAFVDDEHLIVLDRRGDSLQVRVERLAGDRGADEVWRRSLPVMAAPALFVDLVGGRWTVAGQHDDGSLVAWSGSLTGGEAGEHRWARDSMWVEPFHFAPDGSVLVHAMRAPVGDLDAVLAVLGGTRFRADLWRFGPDGRQRLGLIAGYPLCRGAGDAAVCVGMHAGRWRLWSVTTAGIVSPIGALPAGYDVRYPGRGPAVAAIARDGTGPLLIDPAAGRATRVRLRGVEHATGRRAAVDARANGGVLAILEIGSDGTTIGLYRLEGDATADEGRTAQRPDHR